MTDIKEKISTFMESEIAGVPGKYWIVGILVLIVLVGVYFFTAGPGTAKITLQVKSGGEYLEGASISIYSGGELVKTLESGKGPLEVEVPQKEINIKISKEGCESIQRTVKPSNGMLLSLSLVCGPGPQAKQCLTYAKGLESAKIYVDKRPGKNCMVTVSDQDGNLVDLGWKVKGGYRILFSYDEKNCPTPDYKVQITCDNAKADLEMSRFLSNAKMYGKINLISNAPDRDKEKNEAENVQNIYVHVADDKGNDLSGIEVKAVDKFGYDLNLGYSNVRTSGTTSFDGRTRLVLPEGQEFYLKAEDPEGNHPPTDIEGPYHASAGMELDLTMKSGFTSTITVKDNETGEPLVGATVYLMSGDTQVANGITDENGQAMFSLEKKDYTLVVTKSMYLQEKKKIQGGQDVKINLQKLNDKNSAPVNVKVTNAHGFGEPMSDITVIIKDKSGAVITQGKTGDNGEIDFGRLAQGNYIAYVPASDNNLENDFSQPFTVEAGKPETVEISIVPPQVKLTINTLVKGYPTPGVHVQVWDVKYNPIYPTMLGEGDSKPPGRIEFTIDKGSVIYLKAMFTDPKGKVFGPLVSEKMTINQDTEKDIDLSETVLKQEAWLEFPKTGKYQLLTLGPRGRNVIPEMRHKMKDRLMSTGQSTVLATAGSDGYLILPVNLPYYDPQTKETFDSVDVEVFTGELGSLTNPEDTPIIIKDVVASDYLKGSQDITGLQILKSDYVGNWTGPEYMVGDTDMGASKYIDIHITSYTGNITYTFKIPIRVRADAEGNANIYYRTIWRKGTAVYTSAPGARWENLSVYIQPAGKGNWIGIKEDLSEQFYAYKAWLSSDENGSQPITSGTISDGSQFYLQLDLAVRQDIDSWDVNWGIVPEDAGIEPVSYSGYILKASGEKEKIYETNLEGNEISKETKVGTEDIIHLAIKFNVDTDLNQFESITDKISGEFDILGDKDHPVEFTVIPVPDWQQTNVPNVLYKEFIYSEFADQGEWVKQDPSFISTYSWKLNSPRKIAMIYFFKNNENKEKNIRLVLEDAGYINNDPKLTFLGYVTNETQAPPSGGGPGINPPKPPIQLWSTSTPSIPELPVIPGNMNKPADPNKLDINFTIPANGITSILVLAQGSPKLAYNSSKLLVFMSLASESSIKKWREYDHGTLDYVFNVTDAETGGKPNLGTRTLKIQVLRQIYRNGELVKEAIKPAWFEYEGNAGKVYLSGTALTNPVDAGFQDAWDYVLADVSGKIVPGKLELETYSPIFGTLKESMRIGGLLFDPQGIQHYVWNSTDLYINNEQNETGPLTITNLAGKNVTINFKWWPEKPIAYNVGIQYNVFGSYGENQGGTNIIPPNGTMNVIVQGGANGNCQGSTTYTLEISGVDEDGNYVGGNYYFFKFECVGGGAQPQLAGVVPIRESKPLDQIDTDSCGIEGKVAKVCDADQFIKFLIEAANEVKAGGAVGQVRTFYVNLGYEKLSVKEMNNIAQLLGTDMKIVKEGSETEGTTDIILPGYLDEVGCGIQTIRMSLTYQRDIQTTIETNSSIPWCNSSDPRFFVGLMNLDEKSRMRSHGILFKGDENELKAFVNATIQAMGGTDLVPRYLYGYAGDTPEDIVGKFTSTGGSAVFDYGETTESQAPANLEFKSLGGGFNYSLTVGGLEHPKVMLYFVYPDDLNLSDPGNLTLMQEARVAMAQDLLSQWFQGIQPSGGIKPDAKPQVLKVIVSPAKDGSRVNVTAYVGDNDDQELKYEIYLDNEKKTTNFIQLRQTNKKPKYNGIINYTLTNVSPGYHCVDVYVYDSQKEKGWNRGCFTIAENVEPMIPIIYAKIENSKVHILAVVEDDDQDLVYNLSWDGTPLVSNKPLHLNSTMQLDISGSEGEKINYLPYSGVIKYTYEPNQGGSHTITVTVSDGKHTVSNSTTIIVNAPNKPPVADFTYSVRDEGKYWLVTLDASNSHDPDGDSLSYSWVIRGSGFIFYENGIKVQVEICKSTPPQACLGGSAPYCNTTSGQWQCSTNNGGWGYTIWSASNKESQSSSNALTVTLTVTDNNGGSSSKTELIDLTAQTQECKGIICGGECHTGTGVCCNGKWCTCKTGGVPSCVLRECKCLNLPPGPGPGPGPGGPRLT